jgi:ketosteroid isomerase-like protein
MAVLRTLDAYAALYGERDLEGIVSLVEPDFQGFGSGPDERVTDALRFRDATSRDFAQAESARIVFSDRVCTVEGNVAWVMAGCRFTFTIDGKEGVLDGRFTGVLRQHEGVWRLAQFHFSMPFGEQAAGSSWPSA